MKKSKKKPTKELRELREFARFVYEQLGMGPRTNGITQEFCALIGGKAKNALQLPHVCITSSGDEQAFCDDPNCPRKKKKKRKARR